MRKMWERSRTGSTRRKTTAALATALAAVGVLLVVSAVAGAAPSSVSRVFAPAHHPTSHALLSTNPSGHLNLFSGTVATAAQFEGDDGDLVPQTMTDWNSFAPVTWTGTAPNQTTTKVVAPWTFYGVTDARGSVDGPPD